jgi:hypothetical protein
MQRLTFSGNSWGLVMLFASTNQRDDTYQRKKIV